MLLAVWVSNGDSRGLGWTASIQGSRVSATHRYRTLLVVDKCVLPVVSSVCAPPTVFARLTSGLLYYLHVPVHRWSANALPDDPRDLTRITDSFHSSLKTVYSVLSAFFSLLLLCVCFCAAIWWTRMIRDSATMVFCTSMGSNTQPLGLWQCLFFFLNEQMNFTYQIRLSIFSSITTSISFII